MSPVDAERLRMAIEGAREYLDPQNCGDRFTRMGSFLTSDELRALADAAKAHLATLPLPVTKTVAVKCFGLMHVKGPVQSPLFGTSMEANDYAQRHFGNPLVDWRIVELTGTAEVPA